MGKFRFAKIGAGAAIAGAVSFVGMVSPAAAAPAETPDVVSVDSTAGTVSDVHLKPIVRWEFAPVGTIRVNERCPDTHTYIHRDGVRVNGTWAGGLTHTLWYFTDDPEGVDGLITNWNLYPVKLSLDLKCTSNLADAMYKDRLGLDGR